MSGVSAGDHGQAETAGRQEELRRAELRTPGHRPRPEGHPRQHRAGGDRNIIWSIQIFPCRSETLAIPDTAAVSGSRPRLQPAGGRRPRRLSGGSFRAGARSGETSARSSVSGHYGGGAAEVKLYIIINIFVDIYIFTQVSIDLDSCSSPARERPSTLPELNSRPASRVMKSFSVDEVGREPVDTSSWPVLASSRLILLSESNFRLNWPRNLLSNFS